MQTPLDENRQGNKGKPRAASGCMLTGLLFSESGVRYIPTNMQKGGRRYHYYTSQAVIKGNRKGDHVGRLAAPTVEAAVAERILQFLQSPSEILDALKRLDAPDANYDKILKLARQKASEWPRMPRSKQADLIRMILHRIVVHDGSIELQLNVEAVVAAVLDKHVSEGIRNQRAQIFSLSAPFRHVVQGKAVKLVIGNGLSQSSASREAIVKAIARARSWYELIVEGRVSGLLDICRQHGLTHRYVKRSAPKRPGNPRDLGQPPRRHSRGRNKAQRPIPGPISTVSSKHCAHGG